MHLLPARLYLASYGISGALLSALPIFLPLILLERLDAAAYAALLVLSGLVNMALVPLLGTATDRWGSARVLIVGEGLFLANLLFGGLLVWSAQASAWLWALHYAAVGAVSALMLPARATLVQSLEASGYLCAAAMLAVALGVAGSQPLATCAAVFVAQFCIGLRIFCGRAQRRLAIPREYLGRFAASHALVNSLAAQAGNALAAVVFSALGPAAWYVIGALAFGLAVALTGWIPDWRTLMSLRAEEARGFYERARADAPRVRVQEQP